MEPPYTVSAVGDIIRNVAGVAEELVTIPPPPARPPLVAVPKRGPIHWSLPFKSKVPPVATERPLFGIQLAQLIWAELPAGAPIGAANSRLAPPSWSVP